VEALGNMQMWGNVTAVVEEDARRVAAAAGVDVWDGSGSTGADPWGVAGQTGGVGNRGWGAWADLGGSGGDGR